MACLPSRRLRDQPAFHRFDREQETISFWKSTALEGLARPEGLEPPALCFEAGGTNLQQLAGTEPNEAK